MRSLLLPLTLAGVLLAAPSAFANTLVSRTSGTFGSGLSGNYIWVRPASLDDRRMEVQATVVGTEIKVTDAAGAIDVGGFGCHELGAAVFCPISNLQGLRIEGNDRNDKLSSDVDLPSVILGDDGNDQLDGGPNGDQLNGQGGVDAENGNDGVDSFVHEPGNDTLDGGPGRDVVNYLAAPARVTVRLDTTGFDDGIITEPDRVLNVESVSGSLFNDLLRGSDEPNTIRGRAGTDTLEGLDGNDVLDGMEDNDTIDGGDDVDTVTYVTRSAPVNVSLNDNANDGEDGELDNVRSNVEKVDGTAFNDVLAGSGLIDADNTLNGNNGNDVLSGGLGEDTVNGGAGADTIVGGEGADSYNGDSGFDTLDYSKRSGEGIEVTLENSPEANDGGPSDGPLGARDNAQDIEGIVGTASGDNITGSAVVNSVDAGAGDDFIDIRDGLNDAPVKCGAGDDTIETDAFPIDFQAPLGGLQLQDCNTIVQP